MPIHLVRLASAPYPVGNEPGFFRPGGVPDRRVRLTTGGQLLPESPHYTDDRVLIGVPDQRGHGRIVLFFHGHLGDVERDVRDRWRIPDQVLPGGDLLIAPQLALDAADSHPGKLARPGGVRRLIDDATAVAAEQGPGTRWQTAPIVIAAFSGGWRAAEAALTVGGIGDRIRGVLLLDALFGGLETFAAWAARTALVSISGDRCTKGHAELTRRLQDGGHTVDPVLHNRLTRNRPTLITGVAEHLDAPVSGPPSSPVTEFLARL